MAVKRISLDTETTGLDMRHGAQPFFVSTCNDQGVNTWWRWRVDPKTRQVRYRRKDLRAIQKLVESADELILQNPKFDVKALDVAFKSMDMELKWDWSKTRDTLLAGHLLASNQPHDLTTMAMIYLRINIQPYDDNMKRCVMEARRMADKMGWRIAKRDLPEMPSAKDSTWKYDMWIPAQLAKELGYDADHEWFTTTEEYANADSAVTISLYEAMMRSIAKRKLDRIYHERLKLLPIIYEVEDRGVTLSKSRKASLYQDLANEAEACRRTCVDLADGEIEDLPVNGVSNALRHVVFEKFKLVSSRTTKKGNASMDKAVLENWIATLPEGSAAHEFIVHLRKYRKRKTALGYMDSYERFWLPLNGDTFVVYPSINPTGTDTLRWSSSNPNEQQISKQEGANLRYCFGPAPGREWWSMDAKNIELRIPAYESGEQELIDLFERPDDPPYYGSTHLLNFHTVYPDIWDKELQEVGIEKVGPHCKKKYASTYYQWCKNGGFAVQYGAVERSDGIGTADRAFHREGSHAKLKERFGKLEALNTKWIKFAEKYGYVETVPDRTVDPERGYPLLCSRTSYGSVLPTVPLNYHVQSTAMWWMMKAMIRVHEYLSTLDGYYLIMQIHDELVFDFPFRKGKGNMPKVRKVAKLMEMGGSDIGIPTPVSIEYHPVCWSESE